MARTTIVQMERLLEREDELAVLVAAVDAARVGEGGLVLICGEAGIGKTSLLQALRRQVAGQAAFLVGTCESLSVPVPLGPLRDLAEAAGSRDLAELAGDDRLALARALVSMLRARGPAVAVIEDAHWADPLTLDVIRLLSRRIESAGVVLIVTYRDEQLGSNPALGLLVGDLATSTAIRRILLRPLSEAAVRDLAAPGGVDVGELIRITGGNPFLVVEALAAEGSLPMTVRDATLARVGRLGAAARGAVDAAAMFGQRISPALLAAVVPGSGDLVDEAIACGVLTDDGQTLGFRHELIRRAVELSIAGPRRADLHARALSALVAHGHVDHARLAHHAEGAGLVVEACGYATLAASEAERVGALREASLQLERALRLGSDLAAGERFELLLRYARTANFSSRMHEALSGAEQAVALADEMRDARNRGRAQAVLAWALWSLQRLPEARQSAEDAVAALEQTDDIAELARAHASRIRMEATAFDVIAAIDAAPRALSLAAQAGLEEVQVDITISLGLALGHRGDPGAAALLANALSAAQAARLHIQTIRAHVNTVVTAADARDHATVDSASERARALFDEFQTPIPRDAVEAFVARSLLDRGRWDEALASAALSHRTGHGEEMLARAVEGTVQARRGEQSARTLFERAWYDVQEGAEGPRHRVLRVALAEAAWLRGDRRAGLAHALDGLAAPYADRFARSSGELALWATRFGSHVETPPNAPEPIARELAGDWRGAIRAWSALDAPYEAALAALPGDERAARAGLAALHRLGAAGAARAFVRERAARGARVPRGPRRSTLANPAGLTRREQVVLRELATGNTNTVIAGKLHVSERTVAHHVSAILRKLGAPTRMAAVEHARSAGLILQDEQVRGPT